MKIIVKNPTFAGGELYAPNKRRKPITVSPRLAKALIDAGKAIPAMSEPDADPEAAGADESAGQSGK